MKKKKSPSIYFTTPIPPATHKVLRRFALKNFKGKIAAQGRAVLNAWADDNK